MCIHIYTMIPSTPFHFIHSPVRRIPIGTSPTCRSLASMAVAFRLWVELSNPKKSDMAVTRLQALEILQMWDITWGHCYHDLGLV